MENPHEVRELRNKLRMMKIPQDDILNTVRRQQHAIDKQKQANETLRQQIQKYEDEIICFEKAQREYNTSEIRQTLDTKKKNLTNKHGLLQADFKAEDDKRRKLEEQVSKARSKAGGMFAQARENEELQFKISTIENRVGTALKNYNKHLKRLENCRNEIDELRKERFTFFEVYGKLEKEEQDKIDMITKIIDDSNKCYTQRDQKNIDLVEMQKEEKQEAADDEMEITRLDQKIGDQAVLSRNPKAEQVAIPSLSSNTTSLSDADEELKNQIKTLQGTLNTILKNAKVDDVDELLKKIEHLETDNYSLFNFVVENEAEKSKIVDEINSLEKRIDLLNMNVEETEAEQNYQLSELAKKMTETDKSIKKLNAVKKDNNDMMIDIQSKLQDLFNHFGLSWEKAPDEKDYVTPFNIMWVLSQLEDFLSNTMADLFEKSSSIQLQGRDGSSSSESHKLSSPLKAFNPACSSRIFDKAGETKQDAIKDILADTNEPLTPDQIREKLNLLVKNNPGLSSLTEFERK